MTRARRIWLLVAIWCVPALLTTAQSYLYDTISSDAATAWLRAALREGLPWAIWIPLTPVILGRATADAVRGRRLVAHIAAALAIAAVFGALNGTFSHYVRSWADSMTLGSAIRMGVIDWIPLQPWIYAGVLATGVAIDSARRRRAAELGRAQLETRLAYAQLGALRAQLQPHFLFNTLNAAVALARDGDAAGTARVLVLLGDLLRQLLRSDAPQEIPLREELGLLETYLEIQRVRFGARLQIRWAIADDVRDALVPQLVLQPLVENALQHGISRRTRAGQLAISAARRGDQLRLAVSDDGPGVAPGFSIAAATGVGLRNTRDRLHRLYGARGRLALTTEAEGGEGGEGGDGGDGGERDEGGEGGEGERARTTAAVELPFQHAATGAALAAPMGAAIEAAPGSVPAFGAATSASTTGARAEPALAFAVAREGSGD